MQSLSSMLLDIRTDFDQCYDFGTVIGRGKYSVVKKCYCKMTQRCYAAKIIRKFRAIDDRLKMNIVENEIRALRLVDYHPSIISLYEVFHYKDRIILVLEYATQHDIQPYLGLFEEEKACYIIYQVLKAIEYLHSKNILHLDIKPENVLLMCPIKSKKKQKKENKKSDNSEEDEEEEEEDEDDEEEDDEDGCVNDSDCDDSNAVIHDQVVSDEDDHDNENISIGNSFEEIKVKLCDFSFSQVMQPGKKILGMMGTVAYSAPEVLEFEPLTKATDMWSMGVLTHVLLTSYTPFGNGNERNFETQTNILNCRHEPFKCEDEYFDDISDEAKSFIESLLQFRPRSRLTVEQALNHSWFKKFNIKAKDEELKARLAAASSSSTTTASSASTNTITNNIVESSSSSITNEQQQQQPTSTNGHSTRTTNGSATTATSSTIASSTTLTPSSTQTQTTSELSTKIISILVDSVSTHHYKENNNNLTTTETKIELFASSSSSSCGSASSVTLRNAQLSTINSTTSPYNSTNSNNNNSNPLNHHNHHHNHLS